MNIPNRGKMVSIHFIFCHLQTIFAYRSQDRCWCADVPLLDQGYVHIRILIPLKGTTVSSTAIYAIQLPEHFWQLSGRNIIVQGTTVSSTEAFGNWKLESVSAHLNHFPSFEASASSIGDCNVRSKSTLKGMSSVE